MKITDPQVIKNGEKDLLEAVQEDLDLNAVRQILRDRMEISSLASRGGQIVVHNNKIAFRLDFDINLSSSLLFDREGNYIDDSDGDGILETKAEEKIELSGFELDEPLSEKKIDEIDPDKTDFIETDIDETDLDETDVNESDVDQTNLNQKNSDQTNLDENHQANSPDDFTLEDTDFEEEELDEELSIILPEYDLEDEPDFENESAIEPTNQENSDTQPLNLENDEILFPDQDFATDESEIIAESDTPETMEDKNLTEEKMTDNDINDILKESREFWEQKKDS